MSKECSLEARKNKDEKLLTLRTRNQSIPNRGDMLERDQIIPKKHLK